MKLSVRIGLAACLLTGLGGIVSFLAGGRQPQRATNGPRWESALQCKPCHQEVYAEWQTSHHGIAFTNPEVRELSDDFRKEECMDCHLPRPLAITGFGKRTLPRRTHFDEGVSCISCHLAADGGILAANSRPEVPCKPQRSAEFLAVDACMSCHNQHATTDQWRASPYAAQGVHCTNCHMPQAPRQRPDGTVRAGRSHVYPGAHDRAMLERAGEFTARPDADDLVLTLTNVGAGHNYPTEERHRAVDLEYRFLAADGSALSGDDSGGAAGWSRAFRFRQPYRDEPGENTQLPAQASKEVRVRRPAGAVAAEVRMWYRLTPFCKDDDARSTLLAERKVVWP